MNQTNRSRKLAALVVSVSVYATLIGFPNAIAQTTTQPTTQTSAASTVNVSSTESSANTVTTTNVVSTTNTATSISNSPSVSTTASTSPTTSSDPTSTQPASTQPASTQTVSTQPSNTQVATTTEAVTTTSESATTTTSGNTTTTRLGVKPGLASPYAAAVKDDNATAYWRFEDSQGVTQSQDAISGQLGTYSAAAILGGDGSATSPGDLAMRVNPYVADPPLWAFDTGTTPIPSGARTIELWFQRSADSGRNWTLLETSGYKIELVNYGQSLLLSHATAAITRSTATALPVGWHHLVITQNGSDFQSYVDGALWAEATNGNGDSRIRVGGPSSSLIAVPPGGGGAGLSVGAPTDPSTLPIGGAAVDELAVYPTPLAVNLFSQHRRIAVLGEKCVVSAAVGTPYQQTLVQDGAIGSWRFDRTFAEPNGSLLVEDSLACRSGSLEGQVDVANAIAGANDKGAHGTFSSIDSGFTGRSPRTVEAWAQNMTRIATGSFSLERSWSDGNTFALMRKEGGAWVPVTSTNPVSYNDRWHHVVFTDDPSTTKTELWIDGMLIETWTGLIAANETGELVVQAAQFDEVATYAKVLTSTEISAHKAAASIRSCTATQVSGVYATAVIADGAVAYWPFGADRTKDVLGCHEAAVYGTNAAGAVTGSTGGLAKGTSFSDSAQIYAPDAGILPGDSPLTVELWSKPADSQSILTSAAFSAAIASGRIQVGVPGHEPSVLPVDTAANLVDTSWHHIVMTRDPNTRVVSLYIDGVQAGTWTGYVQSSNDPLLSATGNSLDEVAVYARTLTGDDVRRHWQLGVFGRMCSPTTQSSRYGQSVSASGPIAYWHLSTAAGLNDVDVVGCRSGALASDVVSIESPIVGGGDNAINGGSSWAFVADRPLAGGVSNRTTEFWFKTPIDDGADWDMADGEYMGLRFHNGRPEVVAPVALSGGFDPDQAGIVYNDGAWHHVALVVTSSNQSMFTLYLDGTRVGAWFQSTSETWPANDGISVLSGNGRSVDEFAVYPRNLSATEIRQHWLTGNAAGPCVAAPQTSPYGQQVVSDGALAYWHLGGIDAIEVDTIGCRDGRISSTASSTTGAIFGSSEPGFLAAGDASVTPVFDTKENALPTGSAPRSVETWFKTDSNATILQYGLLVLTGGTNGITMSDGSTTTDRPNSGQFRSLADGLWHHVVLTYSNDIAVVYVDGVDVIARPTYLSGLISQRLGAGYSVASIDELAVYGRALTASEVRHHWTLGSSGSICAHTVTPTPYLQLLVGDGASHYWSFDETSGNRVEDLIGCDVASRATSAATIDGAPVGSPSALGSGGPVPVRIGGDVSAPGETAQSTEFWFSTRSTNLQLLSRRGNSGCFRDYWGWGTYCVYPANVARVSGGFLQIGAGSAGTRSVNDGIWHHVVFTNDPIAAEHHVFLDGELYANVPTAQYGGTIEVLGNYATETPNSPGAIDELAFYPQALTLAQAKTHYLAGRAAATSITLSGPVSDPWPAGEPLTFSASVTRNNAPVTTGSVSFFDADRLLATVALDANGSASTTTVIAQGNHIVRAHFNGTGELAPSDATPIIRQTEAFATTVAIVEIAPSETVSGEEVLLTAKVVGPTGIAEKPSGYVTFRIDGIYAGMAAVDSIGSASVQVSGATAGLHQVTAVFGSGTLKFAGSTSSVASLATVKEATVITVVPPTIDLAEPTSYVHVRVSAVAPGTTPPSGVLRVSSVGVATKDYSISYEGASTSGVFIPIDSARGTNTWTFAYLGDTNAEPVTTSVSLTTGQSASTVAIGVPQQVRAGNPIDVRVSVVAQAPSTLIPIGMIRLFQDDVVIATKSLDAVGSVSFAVPTASVGSVSFRAEYLGSDVMVGGSSNSSVVTIVSATDPIEILSVPVRVGVGNVVSVGAAVARVGAKPFAQGSVRLFVDGRQSQTGALDGVGTVTFAVKNLAIGTHTFSVSHDGDANYVASSSTEKSALVMAPINLEISAAPSVGAAPLTTTFSATYDTSGGAVAISWDFGDATSASGNTISHTFSKNRTYFITARANRLGQIETAQLRITPTADPVNAALESTDITTVQGADVKFNASPSTGSVSKYDWDFGDGSTGVGLKPVHRYSAVGDYTVTLTVRGQQQTVTGHGFGFQMDATSSVTQGKVSVKPKFDINLRVVSKTDGHAIAGADLVLKSASTEYRGITGANGDAELPQIDRDAYSVSIYADGFLPFESSLKYPIASAGVLFKLDDGSAATASFDPPVLLTREQIIAAGLAPDAEANRTVTKYSLNIGSTLRQVTICVNAFDREVPCPQSTTTLPSTGSTGGGSGGGGGGGGGGLPPVTDGKYTYIRQVTRDQIQVLRVPLEATLQKEYFEAHMFITNRAKQSGFVLKNGVASLVLPKPVTPAQPFLTVMGEAKTRATKAECAYATEHLDGSPSSFIVPDIDAGGCAEVAWVVRGDETGSYYLNATYNAILQPFGRVVSTAATSDLITIWGADALQFRVTTETPEGRNNLLPGDIVTYTLYVKNVSPHKVYSVWIPGVGSSEEFASQDNSADLVIDELDAGQEKLVRTFSLISKKQQVLIIPNFAANVGQVTVPATQNAPIAAPEAAAFTYEPSTTKLRWAEMPGVDHYEIFLSTSNLLSATPSISAEGSATSILVPSGQNDFLVAEIVTADAAGVKTRRHKAIYRDQLATAPPGEIDVKVRRTGELSLGLYKVQLIMNGVTSSAPVVCAISEGPEPTGGRSQTTQALGGQAKCVFDFAKPRGLFKATMFVDANRNGIVDGSESLKEVVVK
jgi:PKD repeat protein